MTEAPTTGSTPENDAGADAGRDAPEPPEAAPWLYGATWGVVFILGLILGRLAHVERPSAPTDDDQRVARWVWAHRDAHPVVSAVAVQVTKIGYDYVTIPLIVAVAGLLARHRRRHDLAAFLVGSVGGQLLTTLLKMVFRRDRPDLAHRFVGAGGYSFPSGHSFFGGVLIVVCCIAVVTLVRPGRWPTRSLLIGLAVVTGVSVAASRVWLSVHYLTDVLSGFALGLAWASGVAAVRFHGGRVRVRSGRGRAIG